MCGLLVETDDELAGQESRLVSRVRSTTRTVFNHATKHTGVGIICAVAYFDPGNWGVDLQAGSQFGYKLLFVVLLAGLFAVYMQILATRLGCVTGLDLATHCRILLYNRPKHTRLWRWLALYPLYALSEIAIISTDLAELLGSAIALCLLFPRLPLWAGVLVTASDVLFLLALGDPLRGSPVRYFEMIIAALVLTVLVCMAVIISEAHVHWGDAFDGFVPSSTLFKSGGLYTSIGILGATVMPHSLFLGSALATQDRLASKPKVSLSVVDSNTSSETDQTAVLRPPPHAHDWFSDHLTHAERENNSLDFIKKHLYHGIVDMVISLLGLAVVINSLILILASAVFFYGFDQDGSESPASLFDAYDLLRTMMGKPAAILFALALLASGQSSSIIATLAGQVVSEGFIRWRMTPVVRRLVTRCLGLIPSMIVAIVVGRDGIDTLLVASQVVLSIVLPFIVFPLIWLTSSKAVMSVKKPHVGSATPPAPALSAPPAMSTDEEDKDKAPVSTQDVEAPADEMVDFSNNKFVMILGYAIWLLLVLANGYAIITLILGEGN